jgi:hypothetical protein
VTEAIATDDEHEHDFRADPSVTATPVRIIKHGEDPKVIKDKPANPDKPVKVKVSNIWSVVHEGQRYVQGDTVTVPESLADEWIRNHWVKAVTK